MQDKLKVKNEIQLTLGDMYLTVGKLYAHNGVFSSIGDITAFSGNIVATSGNIRTIGGSVIADTGAIRAVNGNVEAGASLLVSGGASLLVSGSAFIGDGSGSDTLAFNGPTFSATNLTEANFTYAGGSRKFRITDANLLLNNSAGPLAANGLGNFIIGDGEVASETARSDLSAPSMPLPSNRLPTV